MIEAILPLEATSMNATYGKMLGIDAHSGGTRHEIICSVPRFHGGSSSS